MSIRTILLAAAAAISLAAPVAGQAATPVYGSWGYDPKAMDSSVKPGDDFWAFVNGSWDKNTPIAADRASAGVGVTVSDQAEAQVRAIVEDLARDPRSSGLIGQQVGNTYATWMDQATIERAGTRPLAPYLTRIAAVKTRGQLLKLFMTPGYASPVDVGIIPDFADPTHYIAAASQGGLGMPDRSYYLSTDPKMVAYRTAYRAYVTKIQALAGIKNAAARTGRIIALETALAKSQWEPARRRDIKAIYNPMDRAKLAALAPQFDWERSLGAAGLSSIKTVIVTEPSAVADAAHQLDVIPLSTWKEWLAYRFVSGNAQFLPKAFDDTRFAFYGTTLRGVTAQRDRWKRGIQLINGSLGEAVGQVYVQRHYPPASDAQMNELIANLRAAYQDRIASNPWMDEATRKEALAKLAAFDPRVGHPVKYIDYSTLKVVRGDAIGNAMRVGEFDHQLELSRLPKPVDRTLWGMTPQTVNAYYDPLNNQITFPAAILQPPYFDPSADPASNYGAIGAVIGHEMGHGFDDQGRQFDASGKVRDWWTPGAAKAFTERTTRLGGQYDAYEAIPGARINGKLTMGENIGDLGGVETAYAAYRKYVEKHGEAALIDGLTGDQRFFIAFAQAWQSKSRPDATRQQLLTDPHSPAKYRVNGIVRNVDAWYAAFNVKPGDKMYLAPADRVRIW